VAGRSVQRPSEANEVAHDLVVRPVLHQLVAQPGDEPAAAEDQERPPSVADTGPRQPLGEIVTVAAVGQQLVDVLRDPLVLGEGFEPAKFFQRWDRARQRPAKACGRRPGTGARGRWSDSLGAPGSSETPRRSCARSHRDRRRARAASDDPPCPRRGEADKGRSQARPRRRGPGRQRASRGFPWKASPGFGSRGGLPHLTPAGFTPLPDGLASPNILALDMEI